MKKITRGTLGITFSKMNSAKVVK